jgi:hypothetical protein
MGENLRAKIAVLDGMSIIRAGSISADIDAKTI